MIPGNAKLIDRAGDPPNPPPPPPPAPPTHKFAEISSGDPDYLESSTCLGVGGLHNQNPFFTPEATKALALSIDTGVGGDERSPASEPELRHAARSAT